jgi:hypothetical protein
MAEIQKLMAAQSGMTEQYLTAVIPEPTTFASVEYETPDEPGANGQTNGQAAPNGADRAPAAVPEPADAKPGGD